MQEQTVEELVVPKWNYCLHDMIKLDLGLDLRLTKTMALAVPSAIRSLLGPTGVVEWKQFTVYKCFSDGTQPNENNTHLQVNKSQFTHPL